MKCPKCNAALVKNMLGYACEHKDFSIGNAKFDSVVNSLYRGGRSEAEDLEYDRNFDERMQLAEEINEAAAEEDYFGSPGKGENGDYSGMD